MLSGDEIEFTLAELNFSLKLNELGLSLMLEKASEIALGSEIGSELPSNVELGMEKSENESIIAELLENDTLDGDGEGLMQLSEKKDELT